MTSLRGKSSQILRIFALLSLFTITACTKTQEEAIKDTATRVSIGIDEALVSAPQIAFAGKVTSPVNNQWLNDYVAIVYKDGEEVGRAVSKLGEFPENDEGVVDGLFFIKIENSYELTTADLVPPEPNLAFQEGKGLVGVKYIYSWLDEAAPGYRVSIPVPSKRIIYSLVILPAPLSELPTEFQDGKTELTANNTIAARASDGTMLELTLDTAVSPTNPDPAQPTQPASPGGVSWTRTVSGFSGSRWDAWVAHVDGQVTGITWEEFKTESLRYNPQLEADGFVFQTGKSYLFPEN